MKGRAIAIIGIISSLFFSFIGFIVGLLVNVLALSDIDAFVEDHLIDNPLDTELEALEFFGVMKSVFMFIEYYSLFFLILSIIALILAIIAKPKNVNGIGVILLMFCFLLFFGGKWLACILVLIGCFQFLQYREPQPTQDIPNNPTYY